MTAWRFAAQRISVLVFGLVAAGLLSESAAAQQQATPEGRIVVIGEGSVSVVPDYAVVMAGVATQGKSVKEAAATNSRLMAAIMAALRDSGIAQKDIRTSRFSIQPEYTSPDGHGPAKLSGYTVSNQVTLTIRDIDKAGDILDRLVGAGATNVGNVQFLHADPSKLLDQAREAAVADAKRKAEIYARASGIALGRVMWVTEDPVYAPPMPMMARATAAPAPVPISAGEDTLHARITVGFATAN